MRLREARRQEGDEARFDTVSDLSHEGVAEISGELRLLLADVFALYLRPRISTGM